MNDATLHEDGLRPVVRFERHLSQPPAAVWHALTDAAELTSWFPCTVEPDEWKVGAAVTFVFPEQVGMTLTGTLLELDEPRVLAYTWGEETLRFELSPARGGGTRLVLTDELDRGIAARNAAGWDVCLDVLAGIGRAEGAWQPRFDHYVASFEPALGRQEGPPEGIDVDQR